MQLSRKQKDELRKRKYQLHIKIFENKKQIKSISTEGDMDYTTLLKKIRDTKRGLEQHLKKSSLFG